METRTNESPNPKGRGARLPPLSPEDRAERGRALQRARNHRHKDKLAAAKAGLPPATVPAELADVLDGIDVALPPIDPQVIANWMRNISKRCLADAVEIALDKALPVDTRLKAIAVVAAQGWSKAPADPQTLIQIANSGGQSAARGMTPERRQELLSMFAYKPNRTQLLD